MHPKPHNNSYRVYSGSQSNGVKNGGPGESYFIFYSLYLFFRSGSFIPSWPLEDKSLQTLKTIHTADIWGPTLIGLKMGGWVSLIIYYIVSADCLGPEASLQVDHLKLKDSGASQQFLRCIFRVPPG